MGDTLPLTSFGALKLACCSSSMRRKSCFVLRIMKCDESPLYAFFSLFFFTSPIPELFSHIFLLHNEMNHREHSKLVISFLLHERPLPDTCNESKVILHRLHLLWIGSGKMKFLSNFSCPERKVKIYAKQFNTNFNILVEILQFSLKLQMLS